MGKPDGSRSLGKYKCRLDDNIRTNLREVERGVWTGSSGSE
jgi:hypothetical protein